MKQIYFLRPIGSVGPIKIGCSIEPRKRLNVIAGWSPIPLEVAACAPGGHLQEGDLHHRFAHLALHGEWFAVDAELAELVEEVARTGRLPEVEAVRRQPNNRVVAGIKSQITRAVSDAEKTHLGYRMNRGFGRPDDVRAILERISGAEAMPPSPAEQAVLVRYVAELRAQPRAHRTFNDRWSAWIAYRDGPNGLRARPTNTAEAAA
ncbi:GIY-YIG nuclease family protein [Sphingomonas baiyangensis]|uniref:GIY-YIG nuclease family protein n=1 Tax=Sphingomonas baiyangensis TaxID=2572576 RepID=A0A4V5PTJ4_9SPHN|nr:GIY-YIG nuclease family protein [Sphingomonas baiyangensis]TKD50198.1 GIY-YIG nuclease family protein [Sphingomonas baiyangensis]